MEEKSDSHGDHDGPQLRESEIRAAAGTGRRLTRSRARELGLEVENVAWAEVGGRKDKKRRLAAEEDPEELGSLQKKDLEDQQQEGKQMSVPAGRVGRRRCRSSMISKHDRQLLGEAPWLVHVSSTALDGREILRCSGTVMEIHHDIHPDKDQVFILTSYHVVFCTSEERLYDPMPKLAIHVDKGKYEGKMLFFSERYQFAILTIELESAIKVKPPRDGPRLCYNQKVITLARDTKMSLKLHHGTTMWQEENCFLFVNCKHLACGIGGPVVNPNGDMVGMSCYYDQDLAVISITTIRTCWKMWSEFGCIARPMLGMCFRNVTLLDIVRQDCLSYKYNITNGFIVDEVTDNCNAEKLGVRRGNVIRLLNVKPCNLPEIEDDLLNIGLDFLRKKPVDDFKLEVYDLIGKAKRDIILPFQITKGSEY